MRLSILEFGSTRLGSLLAALRPLASIKGSWRFARRYPVLPGGIILLLVILAIFAGQIAPQDPLDSTLSDTRAPPVWLAGGGWDHILGADHIGRDILSRIIHGTRISLMVAGVVLTAGMIVGVTLGIVAGYSGGIWDEIIMRLVDMTYAIPFILVALVAAVIFGASLQLVLILLAVFNWPPFARQTRGLTLQLRNAEYVLSARISGASPFRIGVRHILPGVINIVVVLATLQVGGLILTESVLSFLGVGIPGPDPAWGSMVADGRDHISTAWWISVMPGIAIFLTVFAFNFLGDWLRDYFDPRLRQL
ncbi:MAG: ABC transporter permease [Chloroflexi bacterium]|nr:ABC transporter permease [Chloroflexota bacterium]